MAHTLLDRPACAEVTEAARVALSNFDANRNALARSQPWLAESLPVPDELTWIFGRDGYLTGMSADEKWHTGCSVPLLAARAILKTMDPGTGSVCFLNPQHAAHIRIAFEHLQSNQALMCLLGDGGNAATLLHCDDFSPQIERSRLWFASGDAWPDQLARILEEHPGLPVPSRFVRLPKVDEQLLERMIADAQRVFTEHTAKRASVVAEIRSSWNAREFAADTPRVCVIARSMFRLWDDAGNALYRAVSGSSDAHWTRFDPDDPAGCSPVALATAISQADAVVAADLSRADLPAGFAPAALPWITWVTFGRIPAFAAAGPSDRLLLADPTWTSDATSAGWPPERIEVATWPTIRAALRPAPSPPCLAIIADTCVTEPPDAVTEYSSHTLLWENIQQLIARDPFAVPDDPAEWVRKLASTDGIGLRSLDVPLFIARLVRPAYAQALADLLIAAGAPLKIHGLGWDRLPRFKDHAAGAVTSREELDAIIPNATALVHVWPTPTAHPIDALSWPVLRRTGRRQETFLRDAQLALAGKAAPAFTTSPPQLSPALLLRHCFRRSA